MMDEPKRRYVNDLPEKLAFLATDPRVRQRHRLSISALSKACGQSGNWLKSAKDGSRGTRSIATEVERKLAEHCRFDPNWPEWYEGSAKDFCQRCLREKASSTDHGQPEAPITSDNQQEGASERPNVTIQNFSHCSFTAAEAVLSARTRRDAAAWQWLLAQGREVADHHIFPTAFRAQGSMIQICALCETRHAEQN